MLFKFILINQTNFCGLLELQIIFINNTLILEYSLYTIKNRDIIPMVEQSLYNNAESKTVVNSLPKELFRRGELGLYEANEFIIRTYKLFELTTDYVQLNFKEFKIYVNPAQLRIIYNFINAYCQNYDMLLMQYHNMRAQSELQVNQHQSSESENQPILNSHDNLLADIILFSPNSQFTSYLIRQLLNNSNCYCNITETDIEYLIEFSPFLNICKLSFTKSGFSMFAQLYNSINLTENDYVNNSKNIFQTLCYILKNNIAINNKLEIQICLTLLFIYYCKYKQFDFNIFINKRISINFFNYFISYLQNCLDQLCLSIQFKKINLKLKNDYDGSLNSLSSDTESKIDEIVLKYKYLQAIDREEFLKKVDNETLIYRNTVSDSKKDLQHIGFLTQTPIDLDLLIKRDIKLQNVPLETYDLDYYLIENRIITKSYYQLLKLIDNQTNKLFLVNELHPVLNKYSDVIINKLIPNINKYKELIEFNQSILVLYKHFVLNQFEDSSLDYKHQMYILYQIILPYIYDVYGKSKFIDCFH